MRKVYRKFNEMTARDIVIYMKDHPGSPLMTEYIMNLCSVKVDADRSGGRN